MSDYRKYPPDDLQEAMDWIRGRSHGVSEPDGVQKYYRVLLHHLQELILTHHHYFALCRYRASTEARNALAKQMYTSIICNMYERLMTVPKENAAKAAQKCLELADVFLEQSGEKKVVVEEVEEALREVLRWT